MKKATYCLTTTEGQFMVVELDREFSFTVEGGSSDFSVAAEGDLSSGTLTADGEGRYTFISSSEALGQIIVTDQASGTQTSFLLAVAVSDAIFRDRFIVEAD